MNDKLGINANTIVFLQRNKENILNCLYSAAMKIDDNIWRIVLEKIGRRTKNIFFVEIGTWDGINCDPLYNFIVKYSLNGICVEPQKIGFQKLQKTYKQHKNITLVNAAIKDKDGTGTLYTIMHRDGTIEAGHSSLKKDRILNDLDAVKKASKDSLPFIVEEPTLCVTFESLLIKYSVKKIDIVQIDAEGGGFDIIKTIPFHLIKPKLIRFESAHLNKNDELSAVALLKKQGYHLTRLNVDYIATDEIIRVRILIFVLRMCQCVRDKIIFYGHLIALKIKGKVTNSFNSTE